MRNNSENIIGSIKDCLVDISDIGYMVQCGQPVSGCSPLYNSPNNSYVVRISKSPLTFNREYQDAIMRANQNNRYYGFDHPNYVNQPGEWGGYNGLENDLENFLCEIQNPRKSFSSDIYRGMKTYMEIQKSLSFLCSYIPDMYDISIISMRIEFSNDVRQSSFSSTSAATTSLKGYTITKNDFTMEPIYWRNKSSAWISLFESKLYPSILDSDIKHIDISFEREMPESAKQFLNEYLKGQTVSIEKESWIKKIIKRIKD